MIIFLYGPDGYRLKENLNIIVGAYRRKYENGVSYYCFDMESGGSFDQLADAVKSASFFDDAKLVVVKNIISSRKSYSEALAGLIGGLKLAEDKSTVMVFTENKSGAELKKTGQAVFNLLNSPPNNVKNFEYLSGIKLSNWIKNKFKECGGAAPSSVVNMLVDTAGNESWRLANEIEKLCSYKRGATIGSDAVELLIGRNETSSIFDLVDAVGSQNKTRAFEMAYRLINSGHDGHYILSMLAYHFENLLSVCEGVIPKHLHPFVARKAASQARKFSKESLLFKFNRLAEIDVASKNGQVNIDDAIYNFIVS